MSQHITTNDGTELYVKDWGRGPTLFFVSSAGTSNELWQYQHAYYVRKGFRVVAYDRRGHGRSDQPGSGYDADTLADDMAVVINGKDLRDITFIAHSFGCAEVVRYLARHGEARVKGIVLVGGTTPFLQRAASNPDGVDPTLIAQVRDGWSRDYPKWALENVRPFLVPESSLGMVEWAMCLVLETPVHVAMLVNETTAATDFRQDCERISVPTLLIHGDRDMSCPLELTAKRTAKLMPKARLAIYAGAPHGLMFTHADRLHADIDAFLAGA